MSKLEAEAHEAEASTRSTAYHRQQALRRARLLDEVRVMRDSGMESDDIAARLGFSKVYTHKLLIWAGRPTRRVTE